MIEDTIAINEEGVRFITSMKFVEPYDYENGVHVEKISRRLLAQAPEISLLLNGMGLRRVGTDPCLDAVVYAEYPLGCIQYKIASHVLIGYWWLMRFFYNNARMFQQIPPAQYFSWRYFTLYVWVRKLVRLFQK